jgi:hypothetical protein
MTARLLTAALVLPLLLGADNKPVSAQGVRFTSEAGRFEIRLPAKPSEGSKTVPTAVGNVEAKIFQCQGPDWCCMVMYSDYPRDMVMNAEPEAVLDGARNGAVANVQGAKLQSETRVKLGKYPGRDVLINVQSGRFFARWRCYLVEERLYQIIVVGSEEFVRSQDTDRMLQSFKLTDS